MAVSCSNHGYIVATYEEGNVSSVRSRLNCGPVRYSRHALKPSGARGNVPIRVGVVTGLLLQLCSYVLRTLCAETVRFLKWVGASTTEKVNWVGGKNLILLELLYYYYIR